MTNNDNSPRSDSTQNGNKAGFFSNLRIRTKVILGFIPVVVVLVIVAVDSFIGFENTAHDVEKFAAAVEEASVAAKIEVTFLKLNKHVREYAVFGKKADAEAAEKLASKVKKHIAHARKVIINPGHTGKVDEISKLLAEYMSLFANARALKVEHDTLVYEKLFPDGEKIVKDLREIEQEAVKEGNNEAVRRARFAMEHGLLIQVYTNILIGQRDEAYAKKTEDEFVVFEKALAGLGATLNTDRERVLFKETQELFDDYKKAYHKVHKDEIELQKLLEKELPARASVINADAEWLEAAAAKEEKVIMAHTRDIITTAENLVIIVSGIGILLAAGIALFTGRAISRPIISMTDGMTELADGNLSVEIAGKNRKDEIGEMAAAVQVFKDNAIRVEKMTSELRESEKEAQESVVRANQAVEDAETMSEDLKQMVAQIRDASGNTSTAVFELNQGSQNLSERTEQQASTLEETAASMEELTATVKQNADNAQQANQLAAKAREVAVNGGEIVSDTVSAMKQIDESSQKISDIIGVIDEIAFQTNLLALNAAVEAARAGDAGKGFAVVASEVRSLAQRSAESSKEIQALITDSGAQVRNGVDLVNKTGGTLEEIVTSIKNVADIVSEIAAASAEQSQGLDEVNQAVTQMDDMTQRNAAMVQQFASVAGSIRQEVDRLVELVSGEATGAQEASAGVHADQMHGVGDDGQNGADPNPVAELVDEAEERLAPIARAANGAADEEWAEF